MKNYRMIFVIMSSLIAATAFADDDDDYRRYDSRYTYATVLSADPIIKTFNRRQRCYREPIRGAHSHRSNKLFATILGAAVGNAVGDNKTNKRMGTVVGAMVGASLADDGARHSSYSAIRCDRRSVGYLEQRVIGYRVRYFFQGETYTTRLKRDPGRYLRIRLAEAAEFD